MAKKKTGDTPKPSAPKPPKSETAPVAPVLEVKPEPVKRYEAPAPSGKVKVRNVSRVNYAGIAPGAEVELDPKHPGLHPLALELEIVKG